MNTRFVLLLALTFAAFSSAQTAKSDNDALVGDWRGDSTCVVRPSACADEKSLYHISKTGDQPNHFSMQGDKIVDGRPVNMGSAECVYVPDKRALTCELPAGNIHLILREARLEGTMHLSDGTLWRNISLKKDGS
jgi:hypothetical protein